MVVLPMPQTIDEPRYVLLWRMDDLLPVFVGMALGFAVGELVKLTLASAVVVHFYRRFREGRPDGLVFHLLYWWGVIPMRSRRIGNPFDRVFLP